MSASSLSPAQQKCPSPSSARGGYAKTQAAREPLLVAQIYEAHEAKAYPTGDLVALVHIGDPQCEPHKHGLRASRATWAALITGLFAADPFLAARCGASATKAKGN